MFDVIVACTKNEDSFGIGLNGRLPWRSQEELELFKEKTKNSILIVGRKTCQGLPRLENRTIFCISSDKNLKTSNYRNKVLVFQDVLLALSHANNLSPNTPIFIAGGAQIYTEVFTKHTRLIKTIHISIMKSNYLCDTFFSFKMNDYLLDTHTEYKEFDHYVLKKGFSDEKQYLELLKDILTTKERTSRNGVVKSSFSKTLLFDLRNGFPLLTTKRMFWRGIVEELLFFIRGDTDSKILENKGINIWKGNTSRKFLDSNNKTSYTEGDMGPMYGYQWRRFNAQYDGIKDSDPDFDSNRSLVKHHGIDQLELLINDIKNDPNSRRLLLTCYNPEQAKQGVLYPCHSIVIQFYVEDSYLDMFCYNRSSDLFLGLPFNIASSSLLLTLIANVCNLTPRYFHLSLGDVHIYKEHYKAVEQQIDRICYSFPSLFIDKELNNVQDLEQLTVDDIILDDYKSHTTIVAPMIP